MTQTLHLGVVEIPYGYDAGGKRRTKNVKIAATTGDVATILEAKYHIMQTFFDRNSSEIAGYLENGVSGAMESVLMGAPIPADVFGSANEKIATRFQKFIDDKEMDGIVAGVPTKASLKGVSHRFKGKRSVPGRPSFQDTGLYETNFKAWID